MKIAIDCRYLGLSGIGRFLESILDSFDFSKHDFYLIGDLNKTKKYQGANYINDLNSPFSIKGLFKSDVKFINSCDVYFTPNFIVPYGIKTRVVSMLHDIIFMDHKEWNKNIIDTIEKKHLLARGLKVSDKVFTVSNFSKTRIGYYYPKYANKVEAHYPGVSSKFINKFDNNDKQDYIIYVGNVKKSKGLKTLLEAMELIKDNNIKLYIVGDNSSFRNKDKEIEKYFANPNVEFSGKIDDESLIKLVQKARFLIQPSFYEGFGSTPIEALNLGTKPIISDIEVFKEVYSCLPVEFFKTGDAHDLADKILNTDYKFSLDCKDMNDKYSYINYSSIIYNELTK
ncbi:MAG: glycosyltransferase family 4 protein [Acholeplasmatales bacterium]|nr:glycosyltransferase family 4 protein [Acholeplasmatales bacterium]